MGGVISMKMAHRLIGRGTIGSCGPMEGCSLIGGSVLLGTGSGLWVSKAQARPIVTLSSVACQCGYRTLGFFSSTMPACHRAFDHDDNELNL